MQISRVNLGTTNSQLRKLKFKDNHPDTTQGASAATLSQYAALMPLFGVECSRLDKNSKNQRQMMTKLYYLNSLSENKYSGSPNRRKNSSVKDKIRQKIMAVIEGRDFRPDSRTIPEYDVSPTLNVRAESRASNQGSRQRPTTVDPPPKTKRKNQLSVLLEPCQVSPKPLQSRPIKFFPMTILQSQKVTQRHHTSTLLNFDQVKQSLKAHKTIVNRYDRSDYSPTSKRKYQIFQKSQVLKPFTRINEEIKPWDSYEFQSLGFTQ